jgi:hypothetical protein
VNDTAILRFIAHYRGCPANYKNILLLDVFGVWFGFSQRVQAKTGFAVAPRYSLGEKPVFARPLEP